MSSPSGVLKEYKFDLNQTEEGIHKIEIQKQAFPASRLHEKFALFKSKHYSLINTFSWYSMRKCCEQSRQKLSLSLYWTWNSLHVCLTIDSSAM